MYVIFSLVVLIGAIIISLTNKEKVKFGISIYLKNLGSDKAKELRPYLCGVVILGAVFPILVYLGTDGVETLLNYSNQTKLEKIHAYEYIGRCYVNKDCRPIMLDMPVQTDQDIVNLVTKIRLHILSKEK